MVKKYLKIVLSAVLVLLIVSGTQAQDGLALMKVETGARPAGMGGAFTAMTGTPDALPYNPAGAFVRNPLAVSFGHIAYWENIRIESGYLTASIKPKLSLHGALRYAAIGEIERRQTPTYEPEGTFDAQNVLLKAGAAYMFSERVIAGVALGWFMEKIDEANGWAFNVDLGVTVQATRNLSLGTAITGLGSDLTLKAAGRDMSRPIDLPTAYRVGAAYVYHRFIGAADIVYLDDEAHGHLGLEVNAHELFQVRTGYMIGYDTKDFTAGASFVQRNLTVDYAFVPYRKDLGTTHMFNLTLTL